MTLGPRGPREPHSRVTRLSEQLSLGVAVPGAGSGVRMGGKRKAFVTLAGIPLLRHALGPFLEHPSVQSVVVALAPEDAADPPAWLRKLDPRLRVVPGGETRLHSVQAALEALEPTINWVLVHDAARPLVTRDIIDRCVEAVEHGKGVVAGWPVADTLKEVGEDLRVVASPDRSRFWGAQTPQLFPRRQLVEAYQQAVRDGASATDDAEIYCRSGGTVRMVEGSPWNLKVTHPEDLAVAEHLRAWVHELERGG